MITGDGVLDGLSSDKGTASTCKAEGGLYTYNSGVILYALSELHAATKDITYIDKAVEIADTAIARWTVNGVLTEPYGINVNS
jgi:rhamnogalacturonyl hydrolase YesR